MTFEEHAARLKAAEQRVRDAASAKAAANKAAGEAVTAEDRARSVLYDVRRDFAAFIESTVGLRSIDPGEAIGMSLPKRQGTPQ